MSTHRKPVRNALAAFGGFCLICLVWLIDALGDE